MREKRKTEKETATIVRKKRKTEIETGKIVLQIERERDFSC